MELREALTQIAEIRRQMAKAEVFRGYRSAPVAFSAVVALAAAFAQPSLVGNPTENVAAYLVLWICVAAISFAAVAVEMAMRLVSRSQDESLESTRLAVEQFVPPILAGALVTVIFWKHLPASLPLLPGLWQVLYSLGIFASARMLPKEIMLVAIFYFCGGMVSLMLAPSGASLAPWCMGIVFGVGQFATAAVLYWKLERTA